MPKPSSGVLAVSDDEIDRKPLDQAGQAVFHDIATGTSENVSYKKNAQRGSLRLGSGQKCDRILMVTRAIWPTAKARIVI
jgi:hypothetical protein